VCEGHLLLVLITGGLCVDVNVSGGSYGCSCSEGRDAAGRT